MKGVHYEISHVERRGPLVTLRLVEPPNTEHKISRDALANVIVGAEAVFVDEPDEPEPEPDREVTNIVTLAPYRALDWFALMFLLIRLNSVAGSGPKSVQFGRAYDVAVTELHEWSESIGYTGIKVWSPLTLYRTLRRWRVSRYASSAVSRKGLEPAPWRRRSALHVAAENIATAIVMKTSTISTSNLVTATNKALIVANRRSDPDLAQAKACGVYDEQEKRTESITRVP